MIPLIVVVYAHEYRAEEVLDTLTQLRREDLADLDDAWYATRGRDGRLRLHHLIDLPVNGVGGATRDALVGSGCVEPVLDGTAGRALRQAGVSDRFLGELGAELRPEGSAILALIRRDAERVLAELVLYGGTVMQTPVALRDETVPSDADRATLARTPGEVLAAVILTGGSAAEEHRPRIARLWWDAIRRFPSALPLYPDYAVIESVIDARASASGDAAARARDEARRSCRAAREALDRSSAQTVATDYVAFVHTLGMAAASGAPDRDARSRAYEVVHELDTLLASPAVGTPS